MLMALIRGGGDLASGIAVRLHRSGIKVIITEIEQPLSVRRFVSFSEAVYTKSTIIEEIEGKLVQCCEDFEKCHTDGKISIIVDPNLEICSKANIPILIDGRMLKQKANSIGDGFLFKIGIGPGFFPGENCDCVIETKRGPFLGRVYWNGAAETDNGIPDKVEGYDNERVLRSPEDGIFLAKTRIGEIVEKEEVVAVVNKTPIKAPFRGVVRGLLHEGLTVSTGLKVGDIDPRCDPLLCSFVSDKALSIGGGVLEAILSNPDFRAKLGS